MGTKVHSKSYLPGYHSMRDLNEDSNGFNWPFYHGDKILLNGQYYNGFLPRTVADASPGYDKDVVKRTMIAHEAIFKSQVYELHRVYRIQRNLMDEIKRKELHKNRIPFETSLSSSPLASQITSEDARKWNIPSFPLSNSISVRPSASGTEDMHSPFSPLKGNSAQAGSFPSQNGSSSKSKDIEVLESRPSKVRRKMFDLHLPADEYIDTEEGEQLRNDKIAPEGGVKLFLGDAKKKVCEGDASRSDSSLRSTNGLADLNEPVQVEETNAPTYIDLLGTSCHGEIRGKFLGPSKEFSMNSRIRSGNGTINSVYMENNGNGRVWLPRALEAGKSESNLKFASQELRPERLSVSSQPIQALFNKAHEAPNFQTDQSKIDLWRERTNCGLERSQNPDSVVASHIPSLYPLAPSSDLAKSWSQSVSSWEKPSSSLSQRSIPVQTHPSQSHGISGDTWNLTGNSRANPNFVKEFPNRNGFYHGSSSRSKELQVSLSSASRDYLNCNSCDNVGSKLFTTHGSGKYYNVSDCMEVKSAKDLNLNVVLPTGLGVVDGERKHEDHFVGLPWLRSNPANNNEATNTGTDPNKGGLNFFQSSTHRPSGKNDAGRGTTHRPSGKNDAGRGTTHHQLFSSSCDGVAKRVETVNMSNNNKILGFPIFEKPCISENGCSLRLLDINLPCDAASLDLSKQIVEEDLVTEKRMEEKVSVFRHHIDLNSCLSEDESSLMPFVASSKVKTTGLIDLEATVVPEAEEDIIQPETSLPSPQMKPEQPQDEVVKMAAEAIVDISSFAHKNEIDVTRSSLPDDASMPDPLSWFVEIASSCGNDIESEFNALLGGKDVGDNGDSTSEVEEIDYFESMTLKLAETKADEYMPKPLAVDNLQMEEITGNLLTTRPRRGQGRRGRQRRDFQRDILPGLTSLSRHEVTEDLQTFGGMMRATGHSWQSGMARRASGRNGCGRGRRRSVAVSPPPSLAAIPTCMQQVNNIEAGLEDRSLTGWGTTRRPRRQRCPAGNPQSIPLS